MEKVLEKSIIELADTLRLRSLKMAFEAGNNGSHLGGGLSTIEIFATLYGAILNVDASNPTDVNRDRLIVSKGHCVLAYYSILNQKGFISDSELESFEINGSDLHGHATRNVTRGIEFSGGSLAMGLPYAIGMALAGKLNKHNYHVYAIVGDGECNEGLVWESLMSASHYKLDNFTIIIDDNKLQYDGPSENVLNLGNLKTKFEAFGFETHSVDGHKVDQLYDAFVNKAIGKPNAIIANTVKGKGVSFMENKKEWHHSRLTKEQYELALSEQPTFKIKANA